MPRLKSKTRTTKPTIATKELKDIKPVNQKGEDDYYRCCTCGKKYKRQQGNFCRSQSQLYKGNNCYLPICLTCLENLFGQYTEILGSEEKAIERLCLHWDMYYTESIVEASKKPDVTKNRLRNYIKNINTLSQNLNKTYDTYLRELQEKTIDTYEELERLRLEAEAKDEKTISERTVKKWGLGYDEDEYQMLNDHYKLLKDKAGDDDVKETLIKDLCEQHILKYRARKDKDVDRYEKISKLYQATLANADLKPKDTSKNTSLNNPDECWGKFISMVENHSPAEFFKDKDIFKDFNGIEEYCNRHIKRSTENLINGTSIRDEEFNVEEGEDN